jgi:hypothetical protein
MVSVIEGWRVLQIQMRCFPMYCIAYPKVQNAALQNTFVIHEARTLQTHTVLELEMEKYENAIEHRSK